MLGAVYPLFIIPKLPLSCFPVGLVEQKALQVYSVWSGGTTLWLYFIPAEFSTPCSAGSLWSVLGRVCLKLPGFASLLGWNFYKQEEESAQTKSHFVMVQR